MSDGSGPAWPGRLSVAGRLVKLAVFSTSPFSSCRRQTTLVGVFGLGQCFNKLDKVFKSVGVPRDQQRVLEPLELELKRLRTTWRGCWASDCPL